MFFFKSDEKNTQKNFELYVFKFRYLNSKENKLDAWFVK